MKILFLTNLYPPNAYGGYERLCFEVACELKNRGHDVVVLTSSYGNSNVEDYGYNVRRELFLFATEGNLYSPFECEQSVREELEEENSRKFGLMVEEENPDVLFVWNLYFFDKRLLRELENSKIPKTYLLTDNWLIAFLNGEFIGHYFSNTVFRRPKKSRTMTQMLRGVARMVLNAMRRNEISMKGHAIFPSQFMRNLYKDAGFRFSGGDAVCYHGVRFLHSSNPERVNRLELRSSTEVRLLFAGRVVNIKGVHTAIQAVYEITRLYSGVSVLLTIVGDTQDKSYRAEIEELINTLGLSESIIFHSPVPEDRLFQLFQEHDIYIFPSLYEPFSLTLILALESGIPTIASDAGGNVEIVQDGESGLVFRAGDYKDLAKKIHSLVKNGTLREKISKNAIESAANYTFDNMISKIEIELKRESR